MARASVLSAPVVVFLHQLHQIFAALLRFLPIPERLTRKESLSEENANCNTRHAFSKHTPLPSLQPLPGHCPRPLPAGGPSGLRRAKPSAEKVHQHASGTSSSGTELSLGVLAMTVCTSARRCLFRDRGEAGLPPRTQACRRAGCRLQQQQTPLPPHDEELGSAAAFHAARRPQDAAGRGGSAAQPSCSPPVTC